MAASRIAFRNKVLTGAFAAVTAVGTIYGAGLKTQQEAKQERQKVAEASAEDRIAMLESRRAGLVHQRLPLERKLAALRERMEAKKGEEVKGLQGKDR